MKFVDIKEVLKTKVDGNMTKKDFTAYLKENVKVNKYISLAQKHLIINDMKKIINKEINEIKIEEIDFIHLLYDVSVVFKILFSYTNIEYEKFESSIAHYDMIMESGLYDYIISQCEDDFKRFEDIACRATGISTITLVKNMEVLFGKEPDVKEYEKIKALIDDIDPEKLKILDSIGKQNDPVMTSFLNAFKTEQMKDALKVIGDKSAK